MDDLIFLSSSSFRQRNVDEVIRNLENLSNPDQLFAWNDGMSTDENEQFLFDSFADRTDDHAEKSSTSTSWRQMKESQRIITENQSKEISSPLNLYKIFQQKSKSTIIRNNLTKSRPTFSLYKSLPDLSFISHYSKELPRSLTTSPLLRTSTNIARTTPSPTLIHQHQQDFDRPKTLKSIKRYKNSKHSTEPFFHPTSHEISSSSSVSKSTRLRCQTDIIRVDPVLHRSLLTDSPPNEFYLQGDDNHILLNLDEPVPISDQSLMAMNSSTLDHRILERITDVIKRLFELKRTEKTFFLNNQFNLPLDSLLKNELCPAIQNILEHGRKDSKKITLWKIIQISMSSSTQIPVVYLEAKQFAQNSSSYWLHRFHAFIFVLLNKNELINWLYYFTRQKDLLQRYYQSPDALILVSISSTFNLFERIMTQLEKLTSLTFHLTYHHHPSSSNDEQINWMMTLSRRTSNETFRSTLSRKINSIFTKTNPSIETTNTQIFQSRISRPSLNVDKPRSVRYRAMSLSSK